MRTNPYERGYRHGDLLNGEARAVIEAEFEEIRPASPRRPFAEPIRDAWQWIKQRLQRAQ